MEPVHYAQKIRGTDHRSVLKMQFDALINHAGTASHEACGAASLDVTALCCPASPIVSDFL
jgi:hypothetical protein